MKKKTSEYIKTIYLSDLDRLNKEEVLYFFNENMPENSMLDWNYGDNVMDVIIEREETDEEYNHRINFENAAEERVKQKELETLRQLKEKYEGTDK